ncbi:DUF3299 domain-containing protein [Roseobacter ponti]|uniref:DUF3299 domain-containing protein n=1 Tax=Roseobacter ponti TaxID=1891787 RepID=A0A858SST6_9RHOB|nr:DUF3299 domain-containing protein [Roseobacter ponti]QJF50651.1 DUF3299 domain-containing protein [Roseobacter ponti]
MTLSRREIIALSAAFAAAPGAGFASTARLVGWDDLIPPGVPYSEIIGEGEIDPVNDTWLPVFDENATRLNSELDGAYIKMPGYMLPIDISAAGVTSFIMVPYVGACIHTPPPPANQLVFVESETPWPGDTMWDPVWVTGLITHELQSTTVADIGYAMAADKIEAFEW